MDIDFFTSVGVPSADEKEFRDTVVKILNDPRGWKKYGYRFYESPNADSINIRLESAAEALCGFPNLSCWRKNHKDIIINYDNWMGKSKSKLPIDRYRNYVINHEVGHALGHSHNKCPIEECKKRNMIDCPASIMQQMSRGPDVIKPCIESDWPLDASWKIDIPPYTKKIPIGVAAISAIAAIVVIVVIVVIIIVAMVFVRAYLPYHP